MPLYTVVLKNLDPKSLHRQIMQLEALQQELMPGDSEEAGTVQQTLKLLHSIEDEVRRQAHVAHQH